MLQPIFFFIFTDALFGLFSGQYWIHFFPVHCYFPGSIVTLREAKCDLMCLEAVVNLKLNWSDTAAVFILALIKARDSSRFNCLWIVRAVHVPPQLFKYLHLFKLAGNSWADSVTTYKKIYPLILLLNINIHIVRKCLWKQWPDPNKNTQNPDFTEEWSYIHAKFAGALFCSGSFDFLSCVRFLAKWRMLSWACRLLS